MKRLMVFPLLVVLILFSSCSTALNKSSTEDYRIQAMIWQQKSSEFRALCYQAYNLARLRLQEELKKKTSKKLAIVLDIDETVLDNSPYQAWTIMNDFTYNPETWRQWVAMANAEEMPGAIEFLKYADSKGVDLFYVSNRSADSVNDTIKNFEKLGIPYKKENFLFKNETSSKKARREQVLKDHKITLLIGDNLSDFSEIFEVKNVDERSDLTDKDRDLFGMNYIVLPNPTYGDWETALAGKKWYSMPTEERKNFMILMK